MNAGINLTKLATILRKFIRFSCCQVFSSFKDFSKKWETYRYQDTCQSSRSECSGRAMTGPWRGRKRRKRSGKWPDSMRSTGPARPRIRCTSLSSWCSTGAAESSESRRPTRPPGGHRHLRRCAQLSNWWPELPFQTPGSLRWWPDALCWRNRTIPHWWRGSLCLCLQKKQKTKKK